MRRISLRRPGGTSRLAACLTAVGVVAALLTTSGGAAASPEPERVTSKFTATDGVTYTATNHMLPAAQGRGREWLLTWAGSADPAKPDFLAVVDATRNSPTYGEVVNTVTLGPNLANEAHHMQYVWHKGDRLFAGALLQDTVFVFDTSKLPALSLAGVNSTVDTPCGTAPDAFQVLRDGTAYASYLGGPDVPGPCTYTNGEVREGNGAAGSPGQIVRMDKDGKTLAEIPAALAEGEDPKQCGNVPALKKATCANPHGIMVNEEKNIMVASDFVEARHFLSPKLPDQANLARQTVRVWDIEDRQNPKLLSVSKMPDGPRAGLEKSAMWHESRVVMEPALPNKKKHKGAFASSMLGGAVFYAPDVTVPNPKWREVFDDTTAYRAAGAPKDVTGGGDAASWLMVSPDDRYLFHTVMGQSTAYGKPLDKTTGMLYVLDIQKLLAAGDDPKCNIDKLKEVYRGGLESDCPAVTSAMPIRDTTDGGPHWGAMDNFEQTYGGKYRETKHIRRLATSNYFIAGSFSGDGNHEVCMYDLDRKGKLKQDRAFRDERSGKPCVDFDRTSWPHGETGPARPHGILFTVSDSVLK
ncbi:MULTISPECIES: hypothetical protein [unclassified Streptomyces]|uniref:hypothetical protein n=1 Tax=Streptomyces sp. NPDC127129 TaxID=3345373 RepID=UPI00363A148D